MIPVVSRAPVMAPDAGSMRAIYGVCHTFAHTEPSTQIKLVQLVDRLAVGRDRDRTHDRERARIPECQLRASVTHDQMRAVVAQPPPLPRVPEAAGLGERGGVPDQRHAVLPVSWMKSSPTSANPSPYWSAGNRTLRMTAPVFGSTWRTRLAHQTGRLVQGARCIEQQAFGPCAVMRSHQLPATRAGDQGWREGARGGAAQKC